MSNPPPSDCRNPSGPRAVVLVGAGPRAQAWLGPLRTSTRLRIIGHVNRSPAALCPEVRRFGSMAEAMRQHGEAAFAVALPPRAAVVAAHQLAAAGRDGVLEAPLHSSLLDDPPPAGAANLRVAHGWVTLAGAARLRAIAGHVPGVRIDIQIRGLPEESDGDGEERLLHGLALARFVRPDLRPMSLRQESQGSFVAELATEASPPTILRLELRRGGPALRATIQGAGRALEWTWSPDTEWIRSDESAQAGPRRVASAPVRALAQLLPNGRRGDDLDDAIAVLRLAHQALLLLPSPLPLGARALRQAASIGQRRPGDLLARLGLQGELPLAPPPTFTEPWVPQAPPEPMELWAYRAGMKPVAFLTVRPGEVERTLSWFPGASCEQRRRRVQVCPQDHWRDRRDVGEERVELYIAQDPMLAKRAAYLQAEVDPTLALRELGQLVGYPDCCIDSFAQQEDRANNTANRYHTFARTLRSDGTCPEPWPWELNNLHTMVAPFYPCSYRCAAALDWTRRTLNELRQAHPEYYHHLQAELSCPVLYFDHEHQIWFDGAARDRTIHFAAIRGYTAAMQPLVGIVATGDALHFDDRQLILRRGDSLLLHLERSDPGLGLVAPFDPGVTP